MMGIEWLKPGVFFGSMLYAVIGVAIFWICFVIVDKLTPYKLWDEIVEKKNVALAIVVGAMAWPSGRSSPRPSMADGEGATPAACRSARPKSRCSPRSSSSRPAGWSTSWPPARWRATCWATRSCSSPPSSAPTCSRWAWAPTCRASSSGSWWRTSCASSCWSGWSAGCCRRSLFALHSWPPASFRFALYALVLLVGIAGRAGDPAGDAHPQAPFRDRYALKDLVSQVLTFDYLGALAVAVAFPLLLVPQLGLIRTGAVLRPAERGGGGVGAVAVPRRAARAARACAGLRVHGGGARPGLRRRRPHHHAGPKTASTATTSSTARPAPTSASWSPRATAGVRLFLNGNLQFHSRDEYRYHEALVHPAMAAHGAPKQVLVLGGGDGMAVREVLKYPAASKRSRWSSSTRT